MGTTGGQGRFEWWAPHDRALRRAQEMYLLGALVAALYVVAPFAVLFVVLHDRPLRALDALLVGLGALAALAAVAIVIAVIAWRGLPRAMLRIVGARPPTADEEPPVRAHVGALSLARGIEPPTIWIVDDDAPNALVLGRADRAHVCMTRGALRLPRDELDALCAFEVSALTCRPFSYCTSAIDVVLFAESCAQVLWALGALVLISAAVGVPAEVAAIVTLCLAGLIVVTRIALLFADRALPRLLDDATGMVDLEAVSCTDQPAPFERLLKRVRDDGKRVGSSWTVAHLWFDRDERDAPSRSPGSRRIGRLVLLPVRLAAPELARRCERTSGPALDARSARVRHLVNRSV